MVAGPPPTAHLRRGSPRVSSRRNTSLVVALGVASLAATSLAAMVATSELLTESITRPAAGGARPAGPRPGPAGRHPGRAAGAATRQAVRRPLPGTRDRAAPAPAVRDPGARRRRGGRRRSHRCGRGRAAPPGTPAPGRDPDPFGRAAVDRTPSTRPPVARPAPRPVRPPHRPERLAAALWRRGPATSPTQERTTGTGRRRPLVRTGPGRRTPTASRVAGRPAPGRATTKSARTGAPLP